MASRVDEEGLRKLIKVNPDAEIVTYINTTAEIKAMSDICCTSANGEKVVKSVESNKIIFAISAVAEVPYILPLNPSLTSLGNRPQWSRCA